MGIQRRNQQPAVVASRGRPHHPVPLRTGFEAFRDSDDAPYYRSELRRISPEETWQAANERLSGVIRAVVEQARTRPLRITPGQLHRWHRFLFKVDFSSAGAVRHSDVLYPVRVIADGALSTRHQRGSGWERRLRLAPPRRPEVAPPRVG
jgi:hypothetical protein